MRKLLNNPAVVLPLAFLALLWVAHSYGLSGYILRQFVEQTRPVITSNFEVKSKLNATTQSEKAMSILIADRWLVNNWSRLTTITNEPFVANSRLSEIELPTSNPTPTVSTPEIEKAEMVIVDKETFDAAIVSTLGLDQDGYFVVFENVLNQPVRKRVGDVIHIKGGDSLMIPTFGIAEARTKPEAFKKQADAIVAKFKLLGVGIEDIPNTNGETSQNVKNIAFIQDANGETKIFKHGQLVHRNPHLGLNHIFKGENRDCVILIDRFGAEYELTTQPEPRI